MPADSRPGPQSATAAQRFTDLRAVRSGLLRGDRLLKRESKWLSPSAASRNEHEPESAWDFHTAMNKITPHEQARIAASRTMSREEWLELCQTQSAAHVQEAEARGFLHAAQRIQAEQEFKTACFRAVADAKPLIVAAEKAEQEIRRVEAEKQRKQEILDDERRRWQSEQQLLEDGGWHQCNRQRMASLDPLPAPSWATAFHDFETSKESFAASSMKEVPQNLPLPVSQYGDAPSYNDGGQRNTRQQKQQRRPRAIADFDSEFGH